MNTTENEVVNNAKPKKAEVTKDDIKAMKTDYNSGITIDQIANDYGYTPFEVEQIVVTPVADDSASLKTQAELDAEQETKK